MGSRAEFIHAMFKNAWTRTLSLFAPTTEHAWLFSGLFVIGASIHWLVGDWVSVLDQVTTTLIYGVASVIAGFVLMLGFNFLAAPYQLYRQERITALHLKSELDRLTTPGCTCAVVIEDAVESIPHVLNAPRILAKYVKVRVSSTNLELRDCRPSITRMRRVIGGQEAAAQVLDPIFLRWSTHGEEIINLRAGVSRYFDVLSTDQRLNRLKFGHDVLVPLSLHRFFDNPATYILDLAIESDSPTKNLFVEIAWNGKWDEVNARQRLDT